MHNEYNNELRGISQIERLVINALIRVGRPIIRAENLETTFGYKRPQANLLLSRLKKKGWLQRLAPGIYKIVPLGSDSSNPVPDDPLPIAVELFSPCYISGWTAAEHWDLTEQIFNSTCVFTQQKQRQTEHKIAGVIFKTKSISSKRFFGLKKIWSNNIQIQIADIHKTIIDIMDDPDIGGGGIQAIEIFKAYIQSKDANIETLHNYAELLNHGAVYKRLGFLIEQNSKDKGLWVDKLHSKIKKGIINFDPNGPKKGPITTKWGIRLNVPLEDIA